MDLENSSKKERKKAYTVARKFKYDGKEYVKGSKIKLSNKQAEEAKKNNMI